MFWIWFVQRIKIMHSKGSYNKSYVTQLSGIVTDDLPTVALDFTKIHGFNFYIKIKKLFIK